MKSQNKITINAIFEVFLRKVPEAVTILLIIYALLPVLSPVLFHLKYPVPAQMIQAVYQRFCHQKVERSMFLFAEEEIAGKTGVVRFYSLEELKAAKAIPLENPHAPVFSVRETSFGYPYWGNEEVGYKVAYCIRDMALYTAMAVTCVILIIYTKGLEKAGKKLPRIPVWVYLVLMLPMVVDGLFQTIVEISGGKSNPELQIYVDNIPKRIVTGALFGVGFGIFVIMMLRKAMDYAFEEEAP
ncbi:DUF2085 domain-containing protein [Candidatus Dojkabacteria bacterium]|nr:DUF2085 domain-containing protein [Candidatus Dojkabacteria bacterium]